MDQDRKGSQGTHFFLDRWKLFVNIEHTAFSLMEKMFGETLRDLRLEAGVGLRELARLIGKSPGYLSDVENARVPPPSEPVILEIAIALQVDKKLLLHAANKVEPELTDYVARRPRAADFLRMAKDQEFDNGDWERLAQLAKIARLGKEEQEKP